MTHKLTLDIPDDVFQILRKQATETGKSVEQVTLERVAQQATPPERGSVDALMPFCGTWQMAPEERASVERMIEEERFRMNEVN